MANRPVFMISEKAPFFQEQIISFRYYNGFSDIQKQNSIRSLHDTFLESFSTDRILEISTKSENELGVKLSAFNLMINTNDGKSFSVESAFQSSKVFQNGGPYKDLLRKSSKEAKRDRRLKESGKLMSFYFSKRFFPLTPTTFFYNWLYINALAMYPELGKEVAEYTAFTDIAFNPERSLNCQARAVAIYVSLKKSGKLNEALANPNSFLQVVYSMPEKEFSVHESQLSIWDMQ